MEQKLFRSLTIYPSLIDYNFNTHIVIYNYIMTELKLNYYVRLTYISRNKKRDDFGWLCLPTHKKFENKTLAHVTFQVILNHLVYL